MVPRLILRQHARYGGIVIDDNIAVLNGQPHHIGNFAPVLFFIRDRSTEIYGKPSGPLLVN